MVKLQAFPRIDNNLIKQRTLFYWTYLTSEDFRLRAKNFGQLKSKLFKCLQPPNSFLSRLENCFNYSHRSYVVKIIVVRFFLDFLVNFLNSENTCHLGSCRPEGMLTKALYPNKNKICRALTDSVDDKKR